MKKRENPQGQRTSPPRGFLYQTPSDKIVIGAGYEEKAYRGESVSATADYQSLAEVVLICLSPGHVKRRSEFRRPVVQINRRMGGTERNPIDSKSVRTAKTPRRKVKSTSLRGA